MEPKYDLIIIGGRANTNSCGIEAKKAHLNYLIIEKGCLVNSLYNYPANMTFFSTSEKLEIGGVPFVSNNIKPTTPSEDYRRITVSASLNIHLQEEVLGISHANGIYELRCPNKKYLSTSIVIATGFYDLPVLLHVPGEGLPKVFHYYKEPHFYALQKVVVVRASNSAVDAALETLRKGAEVTMVIRGPGIGERVKYWVKPDIENRIKEGGIKAYFNSSVSAIREKEIDIQTQDGLITLPNDFVIALTGYPAQF